MNIGILGGTFNPIHYGHLFMANYVQDYADLDKILFIPSGNPPHKKEVIDKKHRKNMLELSINNNDNFMIEYYELEKEGYSYTYNTVNYLYDKNKNDKFYYIIGQDAFIFFDEWYRFEELLKMLDFIVITRGEDIKNQIENKYKKYELSINFIKMPNIEISSTQIRKRIKENKSIRYFVDEKVERYIKENNLYS